MSSVAGRTADDADCTDEERSKNSSAQFAQSAVQSPCQNKNGCAADSLFHCKDFPASVGAAVLKAAVEGGANEISVAIDDHAAGRLTDAAGARKGIENSKPASGREPINYSFKVLAS